MRGSFLTSLLWKYGSDITNADPGDEAIAVESREDWLRRRNIKCAGVQHRAVAKESEELLKKAKANKPRNPFDQPFNDDPRLGSRK